MNSTGRCLLAKARMKGGFSLGNGLRNSMSIDGQPGFTGYPVVGNHSNLQAAGACLFDSENGLRTICAWDPRIHGSFTHQMAFSISMANISNFIRDVKKLRDMASDSPCGADWYNGILFRFIRASTAYLANTSDCVEIDITYYRAHDPQPRLHEDVLEEIDQMGLFKFGGLPHWGKNRNICFLGMKEKLKGRTEKFVKVMKKFDPKGLFSSEWSDRVLGLQEKGLVIDKPGARRLEYLLS